MHEPGSPSAWRTVFNRRRADGSFYYSNEDVKNVLPVVVVRSRVAKDLTQLGGAALRMIVAFLDKLGVDPKNTDPADFDARLEAHWAQHPPNPELMAELRDLAVDVASAKTVSAGAFRCPAGVSQVRLQKAPAPQGSIRVGVGPRFALRGWAGPSTQ